LIFALNGVGGAAPFFSKDSDLVLFDLKIEAFDRKLELDVVEVGLVSNLLFPAPSTTVVVMAGPPDFVFIELERDGLSLSNFTIPGAGDGVSRSFFPAGEVESSGNSSDKGFRKSDSHKGLKIRAAYIVLQSERFG